MDPNLKRRLPQTITFFQNFLVIVAVPQLIQSGTISLALGLLIGAISVLISVSLLSFRLKESAQKKAVMKIYVAIAAIALVLMESFIYTLSGVSSAYGYLVIVPITIAILLAPIYLYYRSFRDPRLDGLSLNQDLTDRLSNTFTPESVSGHEVYESEKTLRGTRFATTTDGRKWKVLVSKDALEDLTSDELYLLAVRKYLEKSNNTAMRLIWIIAILIAAYVDVLIVLFWLTPHLPPDYAIIILGITAVTVVAIFLLPFELMFLSLRSSMKIDRLILDQTGKSEELVSLIRKTTGPSDALKARMSARQIERGQRRSNKMINKRIKRIKSRQSEPVRGT